MMKQILWRFYIKLHPKAGPPLNIPRESGLLSHNPHNYHIIMGICLMNIFILIVYIYKESYSVHLIADGICQTGMDWDPTYFPLGQ